MIQKVLIANRGEIAVRIIQACHELNIETVAVYSEPDRDSLHVRLADEAFCIGPAPANESYLHMENIMRVAMLTKSDAIHPGYGFLAENATFAHMCETFNITFIGPTAATIEQMGVKDVARKTMQDHGVPVTPGSHGLVETEEEALKWADELGFPVILKATVGGGGKGIRTVYTKEDLQKAIQVTRQEAHASFGNSGIYIERFIENFRHIEVQIIGDTYGNVVHLGERDCTIQRRMQKLVEEAPSPAISESAREKLGEMAVTAAKAVDYVGAGTVEFIYDRSKNDFYFMEMNTRIQVEHPITEMITGVDLIQEQIKVASGLKLSITQEDITLEGCSIECRMNAEDPDNNFMPSPGKITRYVAPGGLGVRVDSAAYDGYMIQPFYDSMIAKLIVHGKNRSEAIAKMQRALRHLDVEGVKTTIPFLKSVLTNDTFLSGDFNTNFLEEYEAARKEKIDSEQ